jgi:hypothetical protein
LDYTSDSQKLRHSGRTFTVFFELMQTEPGFAPRGLGTVVDLMQETETAPALRALLCHAVMPAALIRSTVGPSN